MIYCIGRYKNMKNIEAIRAALRFEISQGQAAYEMLQNGYAGNIDNYIADYERDYITEDTPNGVIVRQDYPELLYPAYIVNGDAVEYYTP